MKPIILIGGGGHAKVIVSILRKLGQYDLIGYTALENRGDLLGIPFRGPDGIIEELVSKYQHLNAVLAVGQVGLGNLRSSIWEKLRMLPISFPSIISPNATLNEGVTLCESAVVMDGVVVNSGAGIGRGAILNTNCTIEHDVVLGEWVHVASGATISGGVTVGQFSMIGAGATIIEGRTIGPRCLIGAGTTVISDLNEPGVYVGCPAHRIEL